MPQPNARVAREGGPKGKGASGAKKEVRAMEARSHRADSQNALGVTGTAGAAS